MSRFMEIQVTERIEWAEITNPHDESTMIHIPEEIENA